MAQTSKIQPPFMWLGRYRDTVSLIAVTITAAFFRFYELTTLPPGLDPASAQIGLQALKLSDNHWVPALTAPSSYAPLWVWLQAIPVHLLGTTELALRIWPAALGTLAVVATWLWVRDWFGARIALIAALLLAVSPWAVTVSRNGVASALMPLLAGLTLWLAGRAWRKPVTQRVAALSAVLAVNLLAGPLGWLLTVSILTLGIWNLARAKRLGLPSRPRLVGLGIFATGAAAFGYFIGASLPVLKTLPHDLGIVSSLGQFGQNLLSIGLMFNVSGDENYRHNLSGEPMLNAFVGLMFVAGLLVTISRIHALRYRLTLILFAVLVAPATLTVTGLPNSSYAVAALPIIMALAAIGTSYMLELWYATFPINSAARSTGQAAITLLLVLTLLQGYTQYFRAWAGSSAVFVAYNEGTTQIGRHLVSDGANGERFVIVPDDQTPIVQFLGNKAKPYKLLTTARLQSLPLSTSRRVYYIGTATRDEVVKVLKAKFPGGILVPHYSGFNQAEIYYTYEAGK